MLPSELFHNEDFLALKDSLGLVPTFSENWTSSIKVAYQDSVIDVLAEEMRIEYQSAVLQSLHNRNFCHSISKIDVFETPNNNLSTPFE